MQKVIELRRSISNTRSTLLLRSWNSVRSRCPTCRVELNTRTTQSTILGLKTQRSGSPCGEAKPIITHNRVGGQIMDSLMVSWLKTSWTLTTVRLSPGNARCLPTLWDYEVIKSIWYGQHQLLHLIWNERECSSKITSKWTLFATLRTNSTSWVSCLSTHIQDSP